MNDCTLELKTTLKNASKDICEKLHNIVVDFNAKIAEIRTK